MKHLIKITFFFLFQNVIFAQSKCLNETFLGKWTNGEFGIEIKCDRIVILDKLNGWVLSEKRSDTYYFLQSIMDEPNIYVTWVQNYAMYDVYSKGQWQKTSSKQQRIFKIEKNTETEISLSISEKKIEPSGLDEVARVNIIKEDEVFEKTFDLTKLN